MKGTHLHVAAKKLVSYYATEFSADFENNKKVLHELGILKGSKEERNKLAGEIGNMMKHKVRNEKHDEPAEAAQAISG
ncbi:MAG: hypothetical protein V1834_02450 [Candidatus Micrarchaeota archaeon]